MAPAAAARARDEIFTVQGAVVVVLNNAVLVLATDLRTELLLFSAMQHPEHLHSIVQ
ncbi:MAG: hypothetical protein WEC15_02665 [Flavobacteriales bacterium]